MTSEIERDEFKPCVEYDPDTPAMCAYMQDTFVVTKPMFPGMYHFCDVLEDIDGKVVGVQLWQSPGAAGVFKPETPRSLLAQLGDILKWALFAIVGGSIGGWVGQLFFNHVFN